MASKNNRKTILESNYSLSNKYLCHTMKMVIYEGNFWYSSQKRLDLMFLWVVRSAIAVGNINGVIAIYYKRISMWTEPTQKPE